MTTTPAKKKPEAKPGTAAPNTTKKPIGRPSTYNEKTCTEICERLANGEPLRQICRDSHMPKWTTVYDWKDAHPGFAERIARAREVGFDAIAQEALEISNTPVIGVEVEESDDGKIKTKRADMLGHRRLQIETRLKLLAKWDPKRFGDKLDLNHGGQADNPMQVLMNQVAGKFQVKE